MKRFLAILTIVLAAGGVWAQFGADPFSVSVDRAETADSLLLKVTFSIPEGHYLYADKVRVLAPGEAELRPLDIPEPKQKYDPFLEETVGVYDHDTTRTYTIDENINADLQIQVEYQGCSEALCFMPQRKTFALSGMPAVEEDASADTPGGAPAQTWERKLADFRVTGRAAGYVKAADFVGFLERSETATHVEEDRLSSALSERGLWLVILMILAGGLLLNLTPCVLPMIPVNVAILGAGAQAGSRTRGFALGAAYGGGIALVYGALGLVVILTGSKFGTLNASPWFNIGVAVVFLFMGLAMFDVIHIDFSRFQRTTAPRSTRRGSFLTAVVLGGLAALLAGACVAPVVISVLLLSADLYVRGHIAGLALPFLLGLGMALPWPFAGAGLSFLPRPGAWMQRVKLVFGLVIVAVALYYGQLGMRLLWARGQANREAVLQAQAAAEKEGWLSSLDMALDAGRREGKPVLIDFWASWCKNCLKMEETTFKDPQVQEKLESFVKVKVQAEDIGSPDTKAMLDAFEAVGLPTYVVLKPID